MTNHPFRKLLVLGLAALTAGAAQLSAAVSVLSWQDFNLGTGVVPGAVAALGAGYSLTTASSQANFNTLLGSGTWDVVIFGEQNTAVFAGSAAALGSYVSGGGKLIAATWLSSSGLLPLMQASSVVGVNGTTIVTSADPIFNNPFALGPTIGLSNPGWGTFSMSYATGAQGVGTLGSGYAVVRGNGGRTLLNAPLFDTYSNPTQGSQFVADEIYSLTSTAVPEPSTLLAGLFALMPFGASALRTLRKSRAA